MDVVVSCLNFLYIIGGLLDCRRQVLRREAGAEMFQAESYTELLHFQQFSVGQPDVNTTSTVNISSVTREIRSLTKTLLI